MHVSHCAKTSLTVETVSQAVPVERGPAGAPVLTRLVNFCEKMPKTGTGFNLYVY